MALHSTTTDEEAKQLDAARATTKGLDVCDVPPEQRCKYPSKFCGNARAAKSTGKLHRFCEFHRRRANSNQKRWTSVRRRSSDVRGPFQLGAAMPPIGPWTASLTTFGYAPPQSHFHGLYADAYNLHQYKSQSPLLPLVDAVWREEPAHPLNDDELHILMTLLVPGDNQPPLTSTSSASYSPAPPSPQSPSGDWVNGVDWTTASTEVFDPATAISAL